MASTNGLLEGFYVEVNGVDVSQAVSGDLWLSLNRTQLSTDGLFLTTGDLILLPDPFLADFPNSFFSPRANFAQWRTGNNVIVEVTFGGASQRIFTGYIRNLPATPGRDSAELTIPICCELTYRNTESEAGDRAGVTLGTAKSRTDILASIATQTGWVGGLGSAVIGEYPINYPVPKTSGTYVQQMGAIAASAGYGLDCDRFGNLRASKLRLEPSIIVERDDTDAFLTPLDGSEEPRGKVRAIATGRDVSGNSLSDSFVIEEIGIVEYLSLGGLSIYRTETYIRKRTTVTEAWAPDYKTHTLVTKVESSLSEDGRRSLILRDITTETKEFSRQADGKLQRRIKTVLKGPYSAPYVGIVAPSDREARIVTKDVESWVYVGEVPASKEIEYYGLRLNNFNGITTSIEDDILLRTERTEWLAQPGDRWRQSVGTYVPTKVGAVIQDIGASTVSFGAQYAPPEPERHIATDSSEAIAYEGSAEFGGVVAAAGEPALYEFEYGVSNAQAEELAELHGAVLVGRHRSWQVSMPLTDAWLSWRPGAGAKIRLPDGTIILALIDGPSINLSANEGVVTFACIDMGSVGYQPYEIPVGRVLSNAPTLPPTPTPPIVTALIPPYIPHYSGDFRVRHRFDAGQVVVDDIQPSAARFGVRHRFSGLDPLGDSNSRFGVRHRFAVDETPVSVALPIESGGTGGTTAAQARANLGLAIAGGDLTGSYPNPAIAQHSISYEKIQRVSAGRLLGNSLTTIGSVEEIAIGANLSLENGVLSASTGSSGPSPLPGNPQAAYASGSLGLGYSGPDYSISGSGILTWNDQSGNGLNVTASGAGWGWSGGAVSDGVNNLSRPIFLNSQNNFSIYVLAELQNSTKGQFILNGAEGSPSTGWGFGVGDTNHNSPGNNLRFLLQDVTFGSAIAYTPATARVFSAIRPSGGNIQKLSIDAGTLTQVSNSAMNAPSGQFRIGGLIIAGSLNRVLSAGNKLKAVIVYGYDTDLAGQHGQIVSYLASL